MTQTDRSQTRRAIIATALVAAGAAGVATSSSAQAASSTTLTGHEHDWDWLVGRWNVRHRRLKARLAGSTEWQEFAGTSVLWLTLAGLGTLDDNVIELPGGTYRAVGIRAFDAQSGLW